VPYLVAWCFCLTLVGLPFVRYAQRHVQSPF
jgi:hypothetical protein